MNTQEYARLYHTTTDPKLPAYQRIKTIISQGLTNGTLTPGAPVPSENELVDALGLSRMTVNRAMRELTTAGLLTRVRGIGTFIAEPKAPGALMEVRNIADEITQRGSTYTARVLLLEDLPAHQAPTDFKGPAYHSLIVHYENGRPFQLEDRLVNAHLIPHYKTQDFTQKTPNEYLSQIAPLTQGRHSIEAILPSPEEAELLELPPSSPCLLIRRHTYSHQSLISVARLLHPGSRIKLEGEF